jgi:hypothetical protein
MTEENKESLYDTLFKISQGNIELFKEETKGFLTAIADRTGAAVQLERAAVSFEAESKEAATEGSAVVG